MFLLQKRIFQKQKPHFCDSIAEKLIDDYLFEKDINHTRNIPYPEGTYTADFKIGTKLIDFFGLAGEHKRYDITGKH